jgi:hypothetical protein
VDENPQDAEELTTEGGGKKEDTEIPPPGKPSLPSCFTPCLRGKTWPTDCLAVMPLFVAALVAFRGDGEEFEAGAELQLGHAFIGHLGPGEIGFLLFAVVAAGIKQARRPILSF